MHDVILQRGREAAAQGRWKEAYDLLAKADASDRLKGPDLALLADVAYAAGLPNVTIETWERAYAAGVKSNDSLAAAGAATRVALHLLIDTALMAPVRGWTRRAERLLGRQEVTPVHAWLAVIRSYERLLSGDFRRAREWARQAIEVGSKRDPAAAALGRIALARSLILDGEVRPGLELLEEAAVATVSGELDPLSTGVVYCELVCALQGLAQYDMAEEWTQAMEQWGRGRAVGSIHGRCRVHRAEILRLRGCGCEAEKEALLACEELRPFLRREYGWPLTELGRVRLQLGDLDGAGQAFRAAHEAGWDSQPGLALVDLARGEVSRAAASIRDALDHPLQIPSKELPPNTDLRRAPLLEAQVEIAIAAKDIDRARWAAAELAQVAARFESKPLVASAALARGRLQLAEGDCAGARDAFESATTLWNQVGAPYEAALARVGLAEALRASGNHEGAGVEFRAARAVFDRIGARLQAKRVNEACTELSPDRIGGAARRKPKVSVVSSAARPSQKQNDSLPNLFRREGEYWSVAFEGQTVRLRDAKGMRYLARLLSHPDREFHVLELISVECGWPAEASHATDSEAGFAFPGDAGAMLDAQAKNAYRRRLAEIDEDIEEAQSMGDSERRAQANSERDFLLREMSRAVGLGGRDRRAGSASERARASVTRAMRFTMARIRGHCPPLAKHLDRSIRTGTFCAYLPDPRVPAEWKI